MMQFSALAYRVSVVLCMFGCMSVCLAQNRSLVESNQSNNMALLVGVSHGLPGIDEDVDALESIADHSSYKFKSTRLMNYDGTVDNIKSHLTDLSSQVSDGGTLFFYYSGHGSSGALYVQDGYLTVENIRDSIRDGRNNLPPLSRLVMFVDSCYSGSLLDPMNSFFKMPRAALEKDLSTRLANNIVTAMQDNARGDKYWEKLFVFASSQADETSYAGSNGSVFTMALKKAFDEVAISEKGTMAEFVASTKKYTEGHHPVERMEPKTLEDEALVP